MATKQKFKYPRRPSEVAREESGVLSTDPLPGEHVHFLLLTDIAVDWDWNSRNKANVFAEMTNAESEGGLSEFAAGIGAKGQLTGIIVRPNLHKKGDKRNHEKNATSYPPFELVSGFRRYAAIFKLNSDEDLVRHCATQDRGVVPGVPNGHIMGVIRDLDDREARLVNGRENLSRNTLDPPDFLHHATGLVRDLKMNAAEIALDQGVPLEYVHRYLAIGHDLDPRIAEHWRKGGEFDGVSSQNRITVDQIQVVSRTPKGKQPAVYKEFLLEKKSREDDGSKVWFEAAMKTAERTGSYLARMVKARVVTLLPMEWEERLPILMRVHQAAKETARKKLAEELERAFGEELKRDETKRVPPKKASKKT